MPRHTLAAAALLVAASVAGAQSSTPVADAMRARLERGEKNIVAAAEQMPADKYGYKPTAPQRSFGEIVLHVAQANEIVCAHVAGKAEPTEAKLEGSAPKDALVARLKRSFAFCESSLKNVTDANLGETIPFYGKMTTSRVNAMMEIGVDLADHYGAMAQYLRLNGMLPPTAQHKM